MLSGKAYTFRRQVRLAVSLAWVGGFVDAVGFIELAVFTSNMTGNTVLAGKSLADGDFHQALYVGFLIAMFIAGAMLAGTLIEAARRRRLQSIYTAALAVEAALLLLTVLYLRLDGRNLFLRGALPCIAMGLQNATITRISGAVVRTTHVTGIVTDLGLELVQFAFLIADRVRRRRNPFDISRFARVTSVDPTFQRLALLSGIWVTFLAGAVLGGLAWRWHDGRNLALLLPAGALVLMVLFELAKPRANIDAFDDASRTHTLQAFGVDPTCVPQSVGMYHLGGKKTGEQRLLAPDLGDIVHHIRRAERVTVLVVTSDVDLGPNALAGLSVGLRALRDEGKDLVLCANDAKAHQHLAHTPFIHQLGPANLCSDPEFAIARAVEIAARHAL